MRRFWTRIKGACETLHSLFRIQNVGKPPEKPLPEPWVNPTCNRGYGRG